MQFRTGILGRTKSDVSLSMHPLSNTDHEPAIDSLITETLLKFEGLKDMKFADSQQMVDAGTLLMRDRLLIKLQERLELTDVEAIAVALLMSLYNASRSAGSS